MNQKRLHLLGHNLFETFLLILAQWGLFFGILEILLLSRLDCAQPFTCQLNAVLLALVAVPVLLISGIYRIIRAFRTPEKLYFYPKYRIVLYGLAILSVVLYYVLHVDAPYIIKELFSLFS